MIMFMLNNTSFKMQNYSENAQNLNLLCKQVLYSSSLPIILINVFGNLLNILVFTRQKFQKTSTGFYFTCLSISDLLQSYLIFGFYIQQYNINIDEISNFMCKLHHYLYGTLPLFSAWMLVIISCDRLIHVKFATKVPSLSNRKIQYMVVCITTFLLSLVNVGSFFILELKNNDCVAIQGQFLFAQSFLFYNCLFLITLVPLTIMISANLFVIKNLRKSKKQVLSRASSFKRREKRFSIIVLSLNLLFFLFYVPVCVAMIGNNEYYYSLSVSDYISYYDSPFYATFYLLVYFRHSHSCLQFFLYLYLNRLFRQELFKLFSFILSYRLKFFYSFNDKSSNNLKKTRL